MMCEGWGRESKLTRLHHGAVQELVLSLKNDSNSFKQSC